METLVGNIVIKEEVCGFDSKEDIHQCAIFGKLNVLKSTFGFTVNVSKF